MLIKTAALLHTQEWFYKYKGCAQMQFVPYDS